MKTVCYFGTYDRHYARTKVLLRGLEENGITVIECRVSSTENPGFKKYAALVRAWRKVRHQDFDAIFVAYPGHHLVWLARLLFPTRPIIFDAFVSTYDSNVHDRKVHLRYSIEALKDYFLDWHSCLLATKVLLDTDAHIDYFVSKFWIPRKKCIRVFVGADEQVFHPRESLPQGTIRRIHFHGNFIPLQGIEYIVQAATLLNRDDVRFVIIGTGQTYAEIAYQIYERGLQEKVELAGRKSLNELADSMANAAICLGIFGDTQKTERVIPNKVYEALAMGKPIITADTPAIRELLTAGTNVALCVPADPASLAEKIQELLENAALRETLGTNARTLFVQKLLPREIVRDLLSHFEKAAPVEVLE